MVIFCPKSGKNSIWNEIFFHSFSAYLNSVWIEILSEWCFFNFLNFFAIFLGIFLFGLDWNGIRDKIYFLFFSANLILVQIEIIAEWSFLIFWKFLLFFWQFSCLRREGTKFRTKFFAIVLRIFLPGSSTNKIWDEIFFFFSFTAYISLVWIEILLEWCFLIFLIFSIFF